MPGDELEAQKGCDGEDVVGKATCVDILLFDFAPGLIHQQAIVANSFCTPSRAIERL